MATVQRVIVTDDISGENITDVKGAETIQFALDGISYEIDLGPINARKFRKVFGPYIQHGRIIEPEPASRPETGPTTNRSNVVHLPASNSTVRAWAINAGLLVGNKGNVPNEVRRAFEAARV